MGVAAADAGVGPSRRDGHHKVYDAFISYAHADRAAPAEPHHSRIAGDAIRSLTTSGVGDQTSPAKERSGRAGYAWRIAPLATALGPSDIRYVDQQLPPARQHDSERIGDNSVRQLSLTNDLDVDDFRVGDEKATQHATRMIGGRHARLHEVIRNRHPTPARPVRTESVLRSRCGGLVRR
jgi:hypothetical protein